MAQFIQSSLGLYRRITLREAAETSAKRATEFWGCCYGRRIIPSGEAAVRGGRDRCGVTGRNGSARAGKVTIRQGGTPGRCYPTYLVRLGLRVSWALVVTATVNYRLGKAGNNAVGPCMI